MRKRRLYIYDTQTYEMDNCIGNSCNYCAHYFGCFNPTIQAIYSACCFNCWHYPDIFHHPKY